MEGRNEQAFCGPLFPPTMNLIATNDTGDPHTPQITETPEFRRLLHRAYFDVDKTQPTINIPTESQEPGWVAEKSRV